MMKTLCRYFMKKWNNMILFEKLSVTLPQNHINSFITFNIIRYYGINQEQNIHQKICTKGSIR